MLLCSIDDARMNDLSQKRLARALEWLASTDLSSLELGRNEIDGDEIFANVMSFETSPADSKSFEAHRAYHDIHCVIEGAEIIEIAPVEDCTPLQDYDEKDDFCLYDGPGEVSRVLLRAGDICLTPPADAHKPGCCVGEPAPLRKLVVKVAV